MSEPEKQTPLPPEGEDKESRPAEGEDALSRLVRAAGEFTPSVETWRRIESELGDAKLAALVRAAGDFQLSPSVWLRLREHIEGELARRRPSPPSPPSVFQVPHWLPGVALGLVLAALVLLLFGRAPSPLPQVAPLAYLTAGRLEVIEGTGDGERLFAGDVVRNPSFASEARVHLRDLPDAVFLKPRALLELGGKNECTLREGGVMLSLRRRAAPLFSLQALGCRIEAAGADVLIETGRRRVTVSVFSGTVNVRGVPGREAALVRAGEAIVVDGEGRLNSPVPVAADSWPAFSPGPAPALGLRAVRPRVLFGEPLELVLTLSNPTPQTIGIDSITRNRSGYLLTVRDGHGRPLGSAPPRVLRAELEDPAGKRREVATEEGTLFLKPGSSYCLWCDARPLIARPGIYQFLFTYANFTAHKGLWSGIAPPSPLVVILVASRSPNE